MAGFAVLTLLTAACGGGTAPAVAPPQGLMLLDLKTGNVVGALAVGEDPIAVAVSPDGRTAYLSDNAPGIVRAISLPDLKVRWSARTGGRPGPLLVTLDGVLVSLYDSSEIVTLDAATGAALARAPTCAGPGQLAIVGGAVRSACAATGFGLVSTGASTWTANYRAGTLVRLEDGSSVALPAHLHPFWLAAGPGDTIYAACEGDDEDHDPGGVVELSGGRLLTLAQGRDVDQVEPAAGRVFAALHGDHAVAVIDPSAGGVMSRWAQGSEPVALAADPPLGLLLVVTDARE